MFSRFRPKNKGGRESSSRVQFSRYNRLVFSEACILNMAIKLLSQIMFLKILKVRKKSSIFVFSEVLHFFLFSKTRIYVKENLSMNMCTQFQVDMLKKRLSFVGLNAQVGTFYAIYDDFGIFRFHSFSELGSSKTVLESFFVFFTKI